MHNWGRGCFDWQAYARFSLQPLNLILGLICCVDSALRVFNANVGQIIWLIVWLTGLTHRSKRQTGVMDQGATLLTSFNNKLWSFWRKDTRRRRAVFFFFLLLGFKSGFKCWKWLLEGGNILYLMTIQRGDGEDTAVRLKECGEC